MAKSSTPKKPSAQPSREVVQNNGLADLFEHNIRCLYWVENHLVKSLPKMVAAAGSPKLKKTFSEHLKITKGQVARLETIFGLLGKQVQSKKSDALEGLTMDGEHVMEETLPNTPARDTGLIMAGQLVENYEMTAYTGMIKLAKQLGHKDIAKLLNDTLAEEQTADAQLEGLSINNS